MTLRTSQRFAMRRGRLATRVRPLAFAAFSLVCADAMAQDSVKLAARSPAEAPSNGQVLETVTVTAERRIENVQEIASSVTVIGGDKVTAAEVRNAGDVIRFVPNMTADTTDGHSRPKFYIRGIGLSDASIWNTNPIGTYQDDVYIWNASTVGFPLFDIQRVEVLRGPQGTLWGKNTTGGAINFITRKPRFESDGYAKVSFGQYNNRLLEGATGGAINEVLAARVSLQSERADLFSRNSFKPERTDRWDDSAARFQLLANLSESLSANLNLHSRDYNGPVLQGGNINVPDNTRFNVPSAFTESSRGTQDGAALTIEKEFADFSTLTSITSRDHFSRITFGGDQVPYQAGVSRQFFKVTQTSQELRLASRKNQTLSWIAGAYYFDGTLDYDAQSGRLPGAQTGPTGPAATLLYTASQNTIHAKTYALFGNLNYQISEKFDVAVGLRETVEDKSIVMSYRTAPSGFSFSDTTHWWDPSNIANRPLTTRASQDDSQTWRALTYDITPTYRVSDSLRVYFRHAKGFNGGNFNATATVQGQVKVIAPEYLKSYEFGAKSEWLNNRLSLNVAAFYYDYTDIQQKGTVVDPTNPLQTVTNFLNAKGGYAQGLEVELAAQPIRNLRLGLNLGLNQTKFTDFQDTPTHNAAGNWFNRVPRLISNLQVEYKYELPTGGSLVFNTDWAYRSKAFFNAVDQTTPHLIEPGYWLGNFSVGYASASGKYQARLYAVNVLDQLYRNTGLASGSYSYGPPRQVGLSLSTRF